MIKNCKIPLIYQKMNERGYTTRKNYVWLNEMELMQCLKEWKNCFKGLLNDNYLEIIDNLSELRIKHTESRYGEWYALLTLEERDELLSKHINFELLDKEFEWYVV